MRQRWCCATGQKCIMCSSAKYSSLSRLANMAVCCQLPYTSTMRSTHSVTIYDTGFHLAEVQYAFHMYIYIIIHMYT